MRIAAVDVGSNSIHMVIAEVDHQGRFRVLDRAKDMVRLGGRTYSEGMLSAAAMDAGVETLAKFKTLADRHEVSRVRAVATSAVREAANGGDFIRRVKREVGWRIKVIQGLEEARLIFLGVRNAMDLVTESPSLIADIGGGSVELILVESGEAVWMDSLKLGVARLSDLFMRKDPPRPELLEQMNAVIDREIAAARSELAARNLPGSVDRVIGTSGTMLNLIAMAAHRAGEQESSTVAADDISQLRRKICRSSRDERLKIKRLDAKRVDLIVAGACVADRILRAFSAKTLTPCTWALREGVLLDFIHRHQSGIEETVRYVNPRVRSVVRLARHLGEPPQHGTQVANLALQLWDQLHDELGLEAPSREWLQYAAILHDIGHHISHKDHQRHSHYLISNGELLGFEPYEIDIIALVARYHRKSTPKESDQDYAAISGERQATVRALSALLRVADALDRSHFGVVRSVDVGRDDERLTFWLDTGDNDAALELWEAEQRCKPLSQLLGLDIVFALRSTSAEAHPQSA